MSSDSEHSLPANHKSAYTEDTVPVAFKQEIYQVTSILLQNICVQTGKVASPAAKVASGGHQPQAKHCQQAKEQHCHMAHTASQTGSSWAKGMGHMGTFTPWSVITLATGTIAGW